MKTSWQANSIGPGQTVWILFYSATLCSSSTFLSVYLLSVHKMKQKVAKL